MSILNEFKEKFKVNEYKIYDSEHWIWSLRPHQATIGAGILSLKRECLTFSELNPEEFTDLNNIIKVIEPTLKKAFDYDVINYLMLMMFDKHVHYHIFPRYENSVEALDKTWKDENWPAIPALAGESLQKGEMEEILLLIKKSI
jgi:diadenosine tetraphosphate (Ap4A) HIT family hydrolase